MTPPRRAGLIYGAAMFAVGFVLGPLRVLLLEPWLGALSAVLAEAVPLLAAMAVLAPWIARSQGVAAAPGARLAMGLWGLVPLLLSEAVLALVLVGLDRWIAGFATAPGAVGLALLAAFALMPLLRR